MKNIRGAKVATLAIVFILAFTVLQVSNVGAATADEVLPAFLSQVIGLDLAQYDVQQHGYGIQYPSEYGGVVKEETINFDLGSTSNGNASAMAIFCNGYIFGVTLHPAASKISLIYAQPMPNETLQAVKLILQRYQGFAQNYSINCANVPTALSMLDTLTDSTIDDLPTSTYSSPYNLTSGDMKLQIVRYPPTVVNETKNHISFTWIYTENGVDMQNKKLTVSFYGDEISFSDTWNLFTVGAFSAISIEEALNIGWAASDEYTQKTFHQTMANMTGANVTESAPGWSGTVYEVILGMVPGQSWNHSDAGMSDYRVGGNTTREPLKLYPIWQIIFYFNQNRGDTVGVQVGVWGDSKEVSYCLEYGYLGLPSGVATPTPPASQSPTPLPSESPQTAPSSTLTASPTLTTSTISPTPYSTSPTTPPAMQITQSQNFPPETAVEIVLAALAATAVGAVLLLRAKRKSTQTKNKRI